MLTADVARMAVQAATAASAGLLQEANALRGMSMASMQLAGPALAGILIVTVGPGYALAIDAASFGVSALYLARLHLPPHVSLPAPAAPLPLRVRAASLRHPRPCPARRPHRTVTG